MPTSDAPAAPQILSPRPPPGRWRDRSAWDGPYGCEPGPRPPLARVAAAGYAAITLILLKLGIHALISGWGEGGGAAALFLVPIILYSSALAYAADRLRSRTPAHIASAWVCAPLLLHAACGLLGAVAFVMGAFSLRSRPFSDIAQSAALLGMLLGWAPALLPYFFTRRGGALLLAAVSGPVAVILVMALS